MMQNREFLEYLQSDSQFMREIRQNDNHHRHHSHGCSAASGQWNNSHCCGHFYSARNHHQFHPTSQHMVPSRRYYRYDSYVVHPPPQQHYQQYQSQMSYIAELERKQAAKEKAPRVPDGPILDTVPKESVPNGPLVGEWGGRPNAINSIYYG